MVKQSQTDLHSIYTCKHTVCMFGIAESTDLPFQFASLFNGTKKPFSFTPPRMCKRHQHVQ